MSLSQVTSRPLSPPDKVPTKSWSEASTPATPWEDAIPTFYGWYNDLLQMGGRPSAPINPDPGPCGPSKSDVDKPYHVADHWNRESNRVFGEYRRWKNFRDHQKSTRENAGLFLQYMARVDTHQEDEGLPPIMQLCLQADRQSKLDEWKEYYIFEHMRLRMWQKRLRRWETKRDRFESEYQWRCREPHFPSNHGPGEVWTATQALRHLEPVMPWIQAQLSQIEAESVEPAPANVLQHATAKKRKASEVEQLAGSARSIKAVKTLSQSSVARRQLGPCAEDEAKNSPTSFGGQDHREAAQALKSSHRLVPDSLLTQPEESVNFISHESKSLPTFTSPNPVHASGNGCKREPDSLKGAIDAVGRCRSSESGELGTIGRGSLEIT